MRFNFRKTTTIFAAMMLAAALLCGGGCTSASSPSSKAGQSSQAMVDPANSSSSSNAQKADAARTKLKMTEDFRSSLYHGDKGAQYQKYIVLHDTESDAPAENIVNYWDNSGNGVASHFVVDQDGSIVQCVPLDKIAHHAGYGDTGHNGQFGITEDGRDDMVGTTPVGSWASDYGMNAWSIGIELVHVGGEGDYPEAQLQALDGLIAYIDAYYGSQSTITDHKAWRSGNSDTSDEFAQYLASYQSKRTYK